MKVSDDQLPVVENEIKHIWMSMDIDETTK